MENIKGLIKKINELYEQKKIINNLELIKLDDFREFQKESEIKFDFPITILVGKNGSGKSTIFKIIKSIKRKCSIDDYFFETELDTEDKGKKYVLSYVFKGVTYFNIKMPNLNWIITNKYINELEEIEKYATKNKIYTNNAGILDIEFKVLIGSFDKSLFFDNSDKSSRMKAKVTYVKKQCIKLCQNQRKNSHNKNIYELTEYEKKSLNYILGKNYNRVTVIKHKYFNGTWGTTCVFEDDNKYSEFNSGTGEFTMAIAVSRIHRTSDNSLVLLDEPEISLHPGAQKRFMEYCLKEILAKKLQIIVSTHSPSMVENFPNKCIKNFCNDNGFYIRENVSAQEAFFNLESSYDKKNIIVEDELAKSILEHVAKEENIDNSIKVDYYPGGAESIKTLLITAFSKSNVNNKYVIFDGDKYIKEVRDLENILDKDKTINYYSREFKEVTNINESSIKWGIDGNKNNNDDIKKTSQKISLMEKYLKYYKEKVFFLPESIPEKVIFDIEYSKVLFSDLNLELVESEENFKEKFVILAKISGVELKSLHNIFIANFVRKNKSSENYKIIKNTLNKIIEY